MRWRRKEGFHNGRSYSSNEVRLGRFALATAWLVQAVKNRLDQLLRFGARPSASTVLMRDGERRFTSLGATHGSEAPNRDAFPFPTKRSSAVDPRDFRILP